MTPAPETKPVRRYYQNDACPGGVRMDPLGPWMLFADHATEVSRLEREVGERDALLRECLPVLREGSELEVSIRALLTTTHNHS